MSKKEVLTKDIRTSLKEMMQKELENLPEILEQLEPLQRINVLCKLMPYVMPKTKSVTVSYGEPENNIWDL